MQDDSGGLDAETFSYCGGRGGRRVRAGGSVDGPKRPRYRIGYDGRAGASDGTRRNGASPRRDDTGARRRNTGTRGDDIGARGHDFGTCNHDTRNAGDDPERPTGEEKEDGEDDAAAGDRQVHRQRHRTFSLSQTGAERVPAIYSVLEIAPGETRPIAGCRCWSRVAQRPAAEPRHAR